MQLGVLFCAKVFTFAAYLAKLKITFTICLELKNYFSVLLEQQNCLKEMSDHGNNDYGKKGMCLMYGFLFFAFFISVILYVYWYNFRLGLG